MSIVRVHKTKNFTVMSNYHFKEKNMSLKAKGLLSLMLSLPDDWNYSIAGLVSLSKDGKDSVMAALAELEKFGFLTRIRTTNSKGQFSGVEYNIYEEPQAKDPVAENLNSEEANAAIPDSANQRLSNTKFTKHYKNKILNDKDTNELLLLLDSLVVSQDLRKSYLAYIEMRKEINAPMTKRGLQMLIQRCERMTKMNVKKQMRLLEIATINNWKNVYHPKEDEIKEETLRELRGFYEGDLQRLFF